jgi:hypothetical protein
MVVSSHPSLCVQCLDWSWLILIDLGCYRHRSGCALQPHSHCADRSQIQILGRAISDPWWQLDAAGTIMDAAGTIMNNWDSSCWQNRRLRASACHCALRHWGPRCLEVCLMPCWLQTCGDSLCERHPSKTGVTDGGLMSDEWLALRTHTDTHIFIYLLIYS